MISTIRTGPKNTILSAATPATSSTALDSFQTSGNSIDLIVTTVTGGAGVMTVTAEVSDDDSTWQTVVDSDSTAEWTANVNTAGVYRVSLGGLHTIPGQYIRLSYSCDSAAGTIAIDAEAYDSASSTKNISAGDIEDDLSDIKTAVEIIDDWDESNRAAVNLISGQSGITANAGNSDASTVRVAVADDDTNLAAIKTSVQELDDCEPATSSTVVNPTSSSDRTGSGLTAGNKYRFCATEDCWCCFCGSGGSATANADIFLPAGEAEEWIIPASPNNYFAAIRDTVDGYVSITELS